MELPRKARAKEGNRILIDVCRLNNESGKMMDFTLDSRRLAHTRQLKEGGISAF